MINVLSKGGKLKATCLIEYCMMVIKALVFLLSAFSFQQNIF